MSGALARLREYFNDELLVQVGRNFVLAPLAESLLEPVCDLLRHIGVAFGFGQKWFRCHARTRGRMRTHFLFLWNSPPRSLVCLYVHQFAGKIGSIEMPTERQHMYYKRLFNVCFLSLTVMLSAGAAWAQALVSARVLSSEGPVEIRRRADGQGEIQKIAFKANEEVRGGDTIVTGRGGRLVLGLSDGSQAVIAPQTTVVVQDLGASPRTLFNLLRGKTRVRIEKMGGQPNPYRVNTPTAVIAVRGTIFDVLVKDDQTEVFLHEGQVAVTNRVLPDQPVLLFPGQTTRIRPQAAPNRPGAFKPGRNDSDFRMERAQGENRQAANRRENSDSPRGGSATQGDRERARVESRPDAGRTGVPSSRPPANANPNNTPGGGRGRP